MVWSRASNDAEGSYLTLKSKSLLKTASTALKRFSISSNCLKTVLIPTPDASATCCAVGSKLPSLNNLMQASTISFWLLMLRRFLPSFFAIIIRNISIDIIYVNRYCYSMNRVTEILGVKYPIIQAPMGWIARSQLASAVSNAGGFGIIETSSGETENCKAEILAMSELTDKPFGVNLPLMFLRDESMIELVLEQGIKFVTTSAGDPSKYTHILKDAGIKVFHAVPSVAGAVKAADAGVDGLVIEGTEGGGFKSPEEVGLMVLIQAIRKHTDLPIVAAGGIVDGRGMAAAFAAGAEGIQMGTRFVSSLESPVHDNYKNKIIESSEEGTFILNKKGRPCIRALKSNLTEEIYEKGVMDMSAFGGIKSLYFDGDMEAAPALAGQSIGLIDEVKPVKNIIEETIAEFNATCDAMSAQKF